MFADYSREFGTIQNLARTIHSVSVLVSVSKPISKPVSKRWATTTIAITVSPMRATEFRNERLPIIGGAAFEFPDITGDRTTDPQYSWSDLTPRS